MSIGKRGLGQLAVSQAMWVSVSYVGEASGDTRRGIPAEAPLEAASACPGVYAKGAYPGYAGDLLVDRCYNRCYNANGANGRKYLVRALFDPFTSTCSTLV
ncbi:hypothetical protein M0R45_027520 [Rubus argutus]|uniref:Uncharacterized protein n=1 Tax=Rubus argutus TaxID=59490 RepID=A0AAW1X2D5_RUBAR